MELKFTIVGEIDINTCQERLEQEFEEHYLYLNCLYKRKDNIRILTLFFDKRLDAMGILKIHDIVGNLGTIKKD